jgi:hypothetical protein
MTPSAQETTSVRVQIVVDAPIDHAFTVFTAGLGTWFPPSTTCSPCRSPNESSSRAQVVGSTTAARMAPSVVGATSSCTSRPHAS